MDSSAFLITIAIAASYAWRNLCFFCNSSDKTSVFHVGMRFVAKDCADAESLCAGQWRFAGRKPKEALGWADALEVLGWADAVKVRSRCESWA